MKKFLALLALLLLPLAALAASNPRTRWTDVPELLRPGKTERLVFDCPVETEATVTVLDGSGTAVATLWENEMTVEGENILYWDGQVNGTDVASGTYTLHIALSGKEVQAELVIGEHAPELEADGDALLGEGWYLWVNCSTAGEITVTLDDEEILRQGVDAGETEISWDGTVDGAPLPAGLYDLEVRLWDATGFSSTPTSLNVEVPTAAGPALMGDAYYLLPSDVSCDHDICYWKLNRGEMDVASIWQVLTQSVTVLSGSERQQAKVYESPDENSTAIAEVTYESQAVHVLEQGAEWTKIEGYSSSVEGSSVANYAGHFVGYVPTSLLKEKEVNQHLGVVIDKLQQRLFVFQDGRLLSTLLCSTGFPSEDAPWNETPSGEFLVISRTGGFWSGELYCDMGLRINDGILLHEVPCLINPEDESRDYSRCERYLGEKASHGCIRIQRKLTPEGVNMQWLWDNLGVGCKVIIWDEIGRELTFPEDAVTLYYNPDNGRQYHSSPTCLAVKSEYWPLTPFTWGELEDEPYASLEPCPACAPQPRLEKILEMNEKNTRTEERGW